MKNQVTLSYREALKFAYTKLFNNILTFLLLGLIWSIIYWALGEVEVFMHDSNVIASAHSVTHYIHPLIIMLVMWVLTYVISMYLWYQLVSIAMALYHDQKISIKYAFTQSLRTFLGALGARTLMWIAATGIYLVFSIIFFHAPVTHLARLLIYWFSFDIIKLWVPLIFDLNFIFQTSLFNIIGFLTLISFGIYVFLSFFFAGYPAIENPTLTIPQDLTQTYQLTRGIKLRLALIILIQLAGTLIPIIVVSNLISFVSAVIGFYFGTIVYYYIGIINYMVYKSMATLIYPLIILFNVHIYKQLKTGP